MQAGEVPAPEGPSLFSCHLYEAISDREERLSVPLDWHPYPEILYFRHGDYRLTLNLQEYEIHEECLYFVNPGELHKLEILSERGVEYALSFQLDILQFRVEDESQASLLEPLLSGKLCFGRRLTVSDLGFLDILKVMDSVVKHFRDVGQRSPSVPGSQRYTLSVPYDQLLAKAGILYLLGLLEANGMIKEAGASEEEKPVRVVKDSLCYIRENFGQKIYVRDLAKLNELNEQYYIRFFGNAIGTSPLEYINRYRVERAREMLAHPGLLSYEVAEACGFRNIGNFIKIFKSFTGQTPHRYRKSLGVEDPA